MFIFEDVKYNRFNQTADDNLEEHNLTNFRTGEDQFKVKMIEETFFNKMFNINEL